MTMNFSWLDHPIHSRAPRGGEFGIGCKFYKGGEFEAFYVPRPIMPQVDEADLPDLIRFIRARGVAVIETAIRPELLRFHQKVDMAKVHSLTPELLNKPLLVSIDDFILDGNHRGAGHKLDGTLAPCLQVMETFENAMALLYSFPKTYEYGDGNYHPVRN